MAQRERIVGTWILTCALLAGGVVAADSGCGRSDNCFILRAPAERIQAIVVSYGLTVVEPLDAATPGVVLVSEPATIPPEALVEQMRSESDVIGFESLTEMAITESAAGVDLNQSYSTIVETLGTAAEHDGDMAPFFSTPLWNGYAEQPSLELIRLHEAHAHKDGDPKDDAPFGHGVIAVIDTGVDPDHPVLAGALVPGYDFLLDQPGIPSEWSALDPASAAATRSDLEAVADNSYSVIVEGGGDVLFENPTTGLVLDTSYSVIVEARDLPAAFGHGTMVAGLVRLVAPGASIMPLRVFDGEGRANVFAIAQAIHWAVDHGANVINMSFSTESISVELMRAINYAHRNGVVCVSSTGNRGAEALSFPAAFGNTVGVASTDLQDSLSEFSNFGPDQTHLAAPGEGITTIYPGGLFAAVWGTSFSTALVAGTVALLHEVIETGHQELDFYPADFYRASYALAVSAYEPAPVASWGHGRLDVLAAVENMIRVGSPPGHK